MNGTDTVIRARGLTKRFGDHTAVDGLDLDIGRGEVFGFLGPNGAGKSTSIRMLVGLLEPSAGSAEVLGLEMPRQAEALRSKLGYMTQNFSLYRDLSVLENLDFAAKIFGLDTVTRRRRVQENLERYGLGERQHQRAATLSGGWRQRLALAVATVHEPPLLLLDEPTAGVDPQNRRQFWAELFELAAAGTTVLVSTHYMDEAIRCHRICLIRRGRRAALGTPAALTKALDGRVVELAADPIEHAFQVIDQRPEVASTTQLGNRLHALLTPQSPHADRLAPIFTRALREQGLDNATATAAKPNLEDVFVALTQESSGQDDGAVTHDEVPS